MRHDRNIASLHAFLSPSCKSPLEGGVSYFCSRLYSSNLHSFLNTPMAPDKIKFGTDGWRAIIAQDFTVYNVGRVSAALAKWLLQRQANPRVVIGHDCRFAGALFAETEIGRASCREGV